QAEDGIRDGHVTGVQTCALPIYLDRLLRLLQDDARDRLARTQLKDIRLELLIDLERWINHVLEDVHRLRLDVELRQVRTELVARSEERRVGKGVRFGVGGVSGRG